MSFRVVCEDEKVPVECSPGALGFSLKLYSVAIFIEKCHILRNKCSLIVVNSRQSKRVALRALEKKRRLAHISLTELPYLFIMTSVRGKSNECFSYGYFTAIRITEWLNINSY